MKIYNINTPEQADILNLINKLSKLKYHIFDQSEFEIKNIRELFKSVQYRYDSAERGSKIKTPPHFWRLRGNCDDQALFWLSWLRHHNFKGNFYFCVFHTGGHADHLFLMYETFDGKKYYFDSLPGLKLFQIPEYGKIEHIKIN